MATSGIYRTILREVQALIVPENVNELLSLPKVSRLSPVLFLYRISKVLNIDAWVRALILPSKYKKEIRTLDS